MQWLDHGVYRFDPHHPPLARVMAALGPYLLGQRMPNDNRAFWTGAKILYSEGRFDERIYDRNIAAGRAGILPFFWIGAASVFLLARRTLGVEIAVIATFSFTFTPVILGHSGLMTTDMALTGMFAATLLGLSLWVERPSALRSVLLAFAIAGTVLSKFSVFVYLPAVILVLSAWYLIVERPRPRLAALRPYLAGLAIAAPLVCLIVWAGYRFTFGPAKMLPFPVPAPALFNGVLSVADHNKSGHLSYLFGELRQGGWWYYYFVVLAVKTPLGLLALSGIGAAVAWKRHRWAGRFAIAIVLGLLSVTLFSRINIGVRHILPIFVPIAILSGVGAWRYIEGAPGLRTGKVIVLALIAWMAVSSLVAHPDYFPYFNELASGRPERILVDSDTDWGQDTKRLGSRLRELGAQQLSFTPVIPAALREAHGFPPVEESDPETPRPGWNAVSVTRWKLQRMGLGLSEPNARLWPDMSPPRERIGQGILLWYFRPSAP